MEPETFLEPIYIGSFGAFTFGIIVYFIGARMTGRYPILQKYSIPEPVSGGLLAALSEPSEALLFSRGVTSVEVRCWSCGHTVVLVPDSPDPRANQAQLVESRLAIIAEIAAGNLSGIRRVDFLLAWHQMARFHHGFDAES